MSEKRTYTPSKQLSGKPMKFKKWSEYAVGDVILCKYLKTTPNKFSETKPNHVVEILEVFLKDKKAAKELPEGTWLCLNTTGMLDKAVKEISPGSIIQITYGGTNVIATGKFAGKEAHSIEVMEMSDSEDVEVDEDEEVDI